MEWHLDNCNCFFIGLYPQKPLPDYNKSKMKQQEFSQKPKLFAHITLIPFWLNSLLCFFKDYFSYSMWRSAKLQRTKCITNKVIVSCAVEQVILLKLSGYWYSSKYQKIVWMDSKMVKLNCLTLRAFTKMSLFSKKSGVSL